MMSSECPFCQPEIISFCLWENAHYCIVADRYPRCVGHILLLSKQHFASHMHAPAKYLRELGVAQDWARRFLLDNFGKASFWENGGIHQEVPHAHLHGMPFAPLLSRHWIDENILKRMEKWEDVWQVCKQAGSYCYVETHAGRYVLNRDDQYQILLNEMRAQLIAQIAAEIDPSMTMLRRGGKAMMDETVSIWKAWARNKQINPVNPGKM
jgi:diadenosine tetraphosphate (Ap4A) HIT family hydrolase